MQINIQKGKNIDKKTRQIKINIMRRKCNNKTWKKNKK